MENKKGLAGKRALIMDVTRSVGIGAAICRQIAKNGGDIFFAYWHRYDQETHAGDCRNDPAKIAAELKGLGVRAESMEIDLAEPSSAARSRCWRPNLPRTCSDLGLPFTQLTLDQPTPAG